MRTVVWGAPCSGKSTYVRENGKSGDVIHDYDQLYSAVTGLALYTRDEKARSYVLDLVSEVHELIEKHDELDAWIITANKDKEKVLGMVERFQAELIETDVSREEAHERCDDDGRPAEWHDVIDAWFDAQEKESNTENRNKRTFMGDTLKFETEKANPYVRRRNALFVSAVDGFDAEAKKIARVFDAIEIGGVEIYCYGDIMDSSWFWEPEEPPLGYITQDSMRVALDQAGGKPVLLRIHSSGGDMMTASAIRAMLMSYPGVVTCQIDGLCASAATYIATAGAKVQMQDSAYFMIHDPSTITIGNVEDHRVTISMLKELKKGIVEAYMAKSTLEQNQIEKMMTDETWMSAQTALEYGFVDEIISQPATAWAKLMAKGSLPVMNHALKGYREVPEGVKEMLNVTEDPATSVPEETTDTEPDQGEIERESAVQALREKITILKELTV